MASKRNFKKDLNKMVFDVVEECFSVQLYNESKTEVTNKLIAEGSGRSTNRDKRNFLVISRGSVFECVAIFDYLKDLNQIDKTSFDKYYSYLEEISKMLLALIKHFEK